MNIHSVTTSHLNLRPFTHDDIVSFYNVLNEDSIMRYFPNSNPPSLERVEKLISGQIKHWAEHGYGWWAVESKGVPGKLIGWNGLQKLPETNEVEVSYLLSKEYWEKGLTTEGAHASLVDGFHRLGLASIVGIVHKVLVC